MFYRRNHMAGLRDIRKLPPNGGTKLSQRGEGFAVSAKSVTCASVGFNELFCVSFVFPPIHTTEMLLLGFVAIIECLVFSRL